MIMLAHRQSQEMPAGPLNRKCPKGARQSKRGHNRRSQRVIKASKGAWWSGIKRTLQLSMWSVCQSQSAQRMGQDNRFAVQEYTSTYLIRHPSLVQSGSSQTSKAMQQLPDENLVLLVVCSQCARQLHSGHSAREHDHCQNTTVRQCPVSSSLSKLYL